MVLLSLHNRHLNIYGIDIGIYLYGVEAYTCHAGQQYHMKYYFRSIGINLHNHYNYIHI